MQVAIKKRQLLGINEAAERIGIKLSTLYAWVHTRQIPYYKIGRLVKFDENEIDRWLESKRVEMINFS